MDRMTLLRAAVAAVVLVSAPAAGTAQHQKKNINLHIDTSWDECAFKLDPSLTQAAWRQFAEEAGLVAYPRALTDARPLGRGNVEVSLLRWATAIDDAAPAWNDTFVHPHETHWLMDGERLPFPAVMARVGVDDRTDVGAYFTMNPESNYGFYGGDLQMSLLRDVLGGWYGSGRVTFVSLFGPEDLDFTMVGMDWLASRTFAVTDWLDVSPYVGISNYLARAHEKSPVVALKDVTAPGSQAMIGAVAQVSRTKVALEFSSARVRTRSLKIGVAF